MNHEQDSLYDVTPSVSERPVFSLCFTKETGVFFSETEVVLKYPCDSLTVLKSLL